uniref:Putative secreted protein n=1 Tax=Anopheles marajoara TaxID=58244 RepID=A0A2M4CFD9_9DIPT
MRACTASWSALSATMVCCSPRVPSRGPILSSCAPRNAFLCCSCRTLPALWWVAMRKPVVLPRMGPRW